MADVEPIMVAMVEKLGDIKDPMSRTEGRLLADSLIDGTVIKEHLADFRMKNCKMSLEQAMNTHLSASYYQNFQK